MATLCKLQGQHSLDLRLNEYLDRLIYTSQRLWRGPSLRFLLQLFNLQGIPFPLLVQLTHRLHSIPPRNQKRVLLLQKVQIPKRRSLTHTRFLITACSPSLNLPLPSSKSKLIYAVAPVINTAASKRRFVFTTMTEGKDGLIDHLVRILFTLFFFLKQKKSSSIILSRSMLIWVNHSQSTKVKHIWQDVYEKYKEVRAVPQ